MKWGGSAADYLRYTQEDEFKSVDTAASTSLRYHDRPADGVVYGPDMIHGKALDHLPGLDRSIGLTKEQHAELHAGRWNGVQYLKKGYQKQWVVDENGRFVHKVDEITGEKERIPDIDPQTGKQRIELVHTAGYDVTFSFDKSLDELGIAFPYLVPVIRACLKEAAEDAMTIGVEDYAKLVRVAVAKPSEVEGRTTKMQGSATERQRVDGLMGWMSYGAAARPTELSRSRGYVSDPLTHVHYFLSSMTWKNGRWYKLDGAELMKKAEYRRDVANVRGVLALERNGVQLEFAEPDRKGLVNWWAKGSKAEIREFYSTNTRRKHELIRLYEEQHGKPPSTRVLDKLMQATKQAKGEDGKIADQGMAEQYEIWRQALEAAGLKLEMPRPGQPRVYEPEAQRIAELHRRLEAPEGLNRYCGDAAIFSHEDVLPATMRAGVGLGLTPDRLVELADLYIAHELIPKRHALKPEARYYTTRTIIRNEEKINDGLDRLAAGFVPSVPRAVVSAVVGRQQLAPDAEQRQLISAVTGPNRLVNAVGYAGAGKSHAVAVAVEALREGAKADKRRREIVVVSLAAKRAADMAREVKADRGGSIESLYRQWLKGWRPTENTVIFLDEAAAADTFAMAKLIEVVGKKAKLVMIGDLAQNPAINVAGWLEHENEKRKPIELTTVYRQVNADDREMLQLLRQGRTELAVKMLDDKNRINVSATPEDIVTTLVDRYDLHRQSGRTAAEVVVVHTGANAEMDTYNRAIQRWRAAHGEIDTRQSFVVSEASTGRRWTLNKGDRVTLLQSQWSKGQKSPVRNGETGELIKVDGSGLVKVRLDNGRKVAMKLPRESESAILGLAYAQSTARYQGSQAKVVLATLGSPMIMNRNVAYSQLSRFTEHLEVHLDQVRWAGDIKSQLAQAFAGQVTKTMATDLEDVPDYDEETARDEAMEYIEELQRRVDQRVDRNIGMSL